ncbi:bifunctional [glutamate--ammonia ligase]-adenylyl-L-tyrosine phosphorylase/[glutamate--ammonia-ligase] adenylyltransferase [Colwelliaceae bacterium 6471]
MKENDLSVVIQEQTRLSWQQFIEQHHQLPLLLSNSQREDLKLALSLSDFVLRCAQQAPQLVIELFSSERVYQQAIPDYESLLQTQLLECETEEQLHRILRLFRLQEMVNIAVADLVLNIDLDESLLRLSNLADALIVGALAWLTNFCQQKWGTPENKLGEALPLLVYGMGKLGGKELNFSSDIDLIFVYPQSGETTGARRVMDNQQFFTRLGQKLITALNQKTADGFVYRVDMRLRPFGESGPIVMTFNAMEDYYQEQGRDWERYAMLKARLIGNSEYHHKLSSMLRPFVYRRYIDFSVIDSLRRMKMMISQEVRRKQLVNNIKLGAGGIREIEFIVQVFQLIRGGRIAELQQRNLLSVLPLLVKYQEITQDSKQVLENAYRFLRRVENILQALDDKQTQTLPDDELNQQRLLAVLKINNWQDFLTILHQHMKGVHDQFITLIGVESPNHQAEDEHWSTLWQSQWEDDECVTWISQHCSFWQAHRVWKLLSEFRQETNKRSLGARGRQVLDKLIPLLIWHLQREHAEELVLTRVIIVLNKIVTRTAYLELLFENEGALKHLIKLCRASSWVTEHIAIYPILLDELIDPQLLNNPPALSSYQSELRQSMLRIPEEDLEAQMDVLRQFKQAQQLRIAASDISGVLPVTKVSDHLTALAEAIVAEVINLAWQQMSVRYGIPESCAANGHKGFAVIGYGKMGGIELGYSSDLDLVFLHDSLLDECTNGPKPVLAKQFYMKLAQRIMHIFNTRMTSGILYELDMRLRPSGNSGVLVVHIDTFADYQRQDAWTWEHQALVRARVVYGNSDISEKFIHIRKSILTRLRDADKLKQDVVTMRDKMRTHLDKSTATHKDIKQAKGGLVDIEFLAQYLVLKNSSNKPAIMQFSDNIRIFERLAQFAFISDVQKTILITSYCALRDQGHRAVLQNENQLLLNETFQHYAEPVAKIWGELMSGVE